MITIRYCLLLLAVTSLMTSCSKIDAYRAERHWQRADRCWHDQDWQGVVDHLTACESAYHYSPAFFIMRGSAYQYLDETEKALADYEQAVSLKGSPEHPPGITSAELGRGQCLTALNRLHEARTAFENALAAQPENAEDGVPENALAWLLAVCNDKEVRDPARAIELAAIACEKTDYDLEAYLDTLAAAHAAAGNFPEAIKYQQMAIAKVATDNPMLELELTDRLELYRQATPYVETSPR